MDTQNNAENARMARKKALEQFVNTIQEFDNNEQATEYALMMISIAVKLVHGTKGKRFKREFLMTAIQDKGSIIFADLGDEVRNKTTSVITA